MSWLVAAGDYSARDHSLHDNVIDNDLADDDLADDNFIGRAHFSARHAILSRAPLSALLILSQQPFRGQVSHSRFRGSSTSCEIVYHESIHTRDFGCSSVFANLFLKDGIRRATSSTFGAQDVYPGISSLRPHEALDRCRRQPIELLLRTGRLRHAETE